SRLLLESDHLAAAELLQHDLDAGGGDVVGVTQLAGVDVLVAVVGTGVGRRARRVGGRAAARPAGVGVDDEGDPHPAAEVARQGLLDGGAGPVAGLEVPLVGHGEAGDAVGGVDPAAAPPLAADLHREALEHAAGPGRLDLVAGG